MKKNDIKWLMLTLVFISNISLASPEREDKERPPSHPAHAPINNFQLTGYVDGSYNYLSQSNRFTSGSFNRDNDITENGFTLQQAAFTLRLEPKQGFGLVFNPILGKDALAISPAGINANVFQARDMGFTVGQAYGLYNYEEYTFKVGEMLTLAGLEQYNYRFDTNFSRSILDGFAQPGIHIGARFLHKPNPYWRWVLGLNNGWSTVRNALDLNHIEAGLGYAPHGDFNVMVSLQSGQDFLTQGIYTGPKGVRNFIDIYGTWKLSKQLSFAMNGDYGVQNKANRSNGSVGRVVWAGMALYMNYQFNDEWRASIRGELFDDGDGFMTGIRQNWREMTLTVAYKAIRQLEISLETRHDLSNKSSFADKTGNGASHNQQSFALAALYTFD